MTPTETRKSSGSTDRDKLDQDQLLARLRQYSMTNRLEEGERDRMREDEKECSMNKSSKINRMIILFIIYSFNM